MTAPSEGALPTARRAGLKRGQSVLLTAMLGVGTGVVTLITFSVGGLTASFQEAFGWNRADIASVYLFMSLGMVLSGPFAGALMDRFGVRLVSRFSIPGLAIIFLLISQFPANGPLLGFRLLFVLAGIAAVGTNPVLYSRAISSTFNLARGLALGISATGAGIAGFLVPPLIAVLNTNLGWRGAFIGLAVLAMLPLPFTQFLFRRVDSARAVHGLRTVRRTDRFALLKTLTFWKLVVGFILIAAGTNAFIPNVVPLLVSSGTDPLKAAFAASMIGLGSIFGRLFCGYLIDRFFAPRVAAAMFTFAIVSFPILLSGNAALAPIATFLLGIAVGAEIDVTGYLCSRYFGVRNFGFNFTLIYLLFTLGGGFGPLLAGIVFDATGGYVSLVVILGIIVALSSIVLLTLPKYPSAPDEGTEGRAAALIPPRRPAVNVS